MIYEARCEVMFKTQVMVKRQILQNQSNRHTCKYSNIWIEYVFFLEVKRRLFKPQIQNQVEVSEFCNTGEKRAFENDVFSKCTTVDHSEPEESSSWVLWS